MLAYSILDVTPGDSDTDIKMAYMAMSERYQPDRYPEHFKRIRAAYEKIRTEEARLTYELFHKDEITHHDLASVLLYSTSKPQLEQEYFHEYFKEYIK